MLRAHVRGTPHHNPGHRRTSSQHHMDIESNVSVDVTCHAQCEEHALQEERQAIAWSVRAYKVIDVLETWNEAEAKLDCL